MNIASGCFLLLTCLLVSCRSVLPSHHAALAQASRATGAPETVELVTTGMEGEVNADAASEAERHAIFFMQRGAYAEAAQKARQSLVHDPFRVRSQLLLAEVLLIEDPSGTRNSRGSEAEQLLRAAQAHGSLQERAQATKLLSLLSDDLVPVTQRAAR